jgi:hypothetical protein
MSAAIRFSIEVEGVRSPGNPMWALSLQAACSSDSSATISEALGVTARASATRESDVIAEEDEGDPAKTPAPTPGPDGEAAQDTVAAVLAAAPAPLNEHVYGVFWESGKLILDVAPAMMSEAGDACEDIKLATGAEAVVARDSGSSSHTRLC